MHKAAVNSSIVWSYDNLAFQTCVLICDSQSQTQLFKFRNQTRSLRDVVAAHLPHVRHADDVRRADERLDFEAALAQHVTKQRRRGAAFEGAAGSERQSRLERLVTSSALVTLLGDHDVEVESNDSRRRCWHSNLD